MIRPLREGVLPYNSRHLGTVQESYYRMPQFVDWFEAVYHAGRNYFVEMEAENGPEIREESVGLALEVDDILSRICIRYGQNHNRRLGSKSNRR